MESHQTVYCLVRFANLAPNLYLENKFECWKYCCVRGVRLGGRAEGSGRVTDLEGVLHNHAAPIWIATRHRPTVGPYLLHSTLPLSLSTCFPTPPTASTRPLLAPTGQVSPPRPCAKALYTRSW